MSAHIPGAIYTDYSRDGWRINKDGIKGLLPDAAQVEALVGRLGIDNDSHVVVLAGGYSAREMAIATRIYWTFKVMGHDNTNER